MCAVLLGPGKVRVSLEGLHSCWNTNAAACAGRKGQASGRIITPVTLERLCNGGRGVRLCLFV